MPARDSEGTNISCNQREYWRESAIQIQPRVARFSARRRLFLQENELGDAMPRGRTDLQPELTRFVRALRRQADRVRRRSCSHDDVAGRLSTFADYLDAKAAALEATPLVQVRPGTPQQGIA